MKKSIATMVALFIAISVIIVGNTSIIWKTQTTNAVSPPIWATFHYNTKRTGRCPYDTGNSVSTLKWKYKTGDIIYSSPAIGSDGTIYTGSTDGNIYALLPNGHLKWKRSIGDVGKCSPTIGLDGTIYIGSSSKYLYALNPNGTLKWKYKTGGYISSSAAIGSNGTIYIPSQDNYLYALNPNGTLKWKYKTGGAIINSSPAISSNGTIYFGSYDNYLYAINPNGTLKWKYKTGSHIMDSSPTIGLDGTIYIGSTDKYVYAIKDSGYLKWKYKTGDKVRSSPAIGSDGTIYIGSSDRYLYALKYNGTLKWKYKTGGYVFSSPAIDKNDIIYVGSGDYYLYAIRSSGTLKWKYKTSRYVYAVPVIDKNGIIYVGSSDHYFYAISYPNLPVPQNFKAASNGTTIKFKWDYPSYSGTNPLYFYIYEYNYTNHAWYYIKRVKYPAKSTEVTGKNYGKHAFKARAVIDMPPPNPDWASNLSSTDIAYVLHTPANFKASLHPGSHSVYLSWNPVDSNATKILVARKIHNTNPLIPFIATLPVYKTTYIDTTAKPNTKYDYWIIIIREDNNFNDVSNNSNVSGLLTFPASPTNLKAYGRGNNIVMSWKHTKECTGYKIYIKDLAGNNPWKLISIKEKNTLNFITGNMPAGKYLCEVLAYNSAGNSPNPPTQLAYILEKPAHLKAEVLSSTQAKITYDPIDENATNVLVEKSTDGTSYTIIGTVSATANFIIVKGLSPGKEYYVRITAIRGLNVSYPSDAVHFKTPALQTPPETPGNLTATAVSSSEIDLFWNDNSDNEDGFKVERKVSGGTYKVIATVPADTTTFRDSGLSPNVTYYYRVKAFNGEGESGYSNEVNATIPQQEEKIVMKLWPDNEFMLVNGKKQEIDPGRGTKPVIIPKWGRTVVPIRAIVEALGGTIEWDGVARKVTIKFNGNIIELWIDNPEAKVNGQPTWIDENNHDVRPIIVNDRTMLPLRFVAENLGCTVEWDPKTRTITITYNPD